MPVFSKFEYLFLVLKKSICCFATVKIFSMLLPIVYISGCCFQVCSSLVENKNICKHPPPMMSHPLCTVQDRWEHWHATANVVEKERSSRITSSAVLIIKYYSDYSLKNFNTYRPPKPLVIIKNMAVSALKLVPNKACSYKGLYIDTILRLIWSCQLVPLQPLYSNIMFKNLSFPFQNLTLFTQCS